MKIRIALMALVLVAAACGDDDAGTATTAAPATTEAATTTAAPVTTEAATTTAAPATTEAVTTTADPVAAMAAELAPYAGDFTGEWVNTTFGSEGPIEATIALDTEAMTLTITLDIGGFVFGAFDPDPETLSISLENITFTPDGVALGGVVSDTFGELGLAFDSDGIDMYSGDVPDLGIATIQFTGPVTPEGADLAYVIEFEGGGGAEGTVHMARTG